MALSFTPWIAQALSGSDETIIVTGAGGWLGQATLEMLDRALSDRFHERVFAFGTSARPLALRSGRTLQCRALPDILTLAPRPCFIFHYAFLTRDRVAAMPLAEFIAQNDAIDGYVIGAARRMGARAIFVPSSGAVYLGDDMDTNPYGVMKQREEQRFLYLQTAMRVAICRVFNLGGPFINKLPSYALSSVLLDLLNNRPITLRSQGQVWRSYVHVRDVVDLAMALLLSPAPVPGEPFDSAGEREIEIGELAQRAATLLNKPEWPIHRPALTQPSHRYVGDGSAMHELFRQHRITPCGLDTQIIDTADYLRGETAPLSKS